MISYIGGRKTQAGKILSKINYFNASRFYDMCCGSGQISMALVKRGFSAKRITMVDNGLWGDVWSRIGSGTFDLLKFADICDQFNTYHSIKDWCEQTRYSKNAVYHFLILQACSFGGRPVIVKNRKFKVYGYRDRIQPNIYRLYGRVKEAVELLRGVEGLKSDVLKVSPVEDAVLFFDPPYSPDQPYYQDNTLTIDKIKKKFNKFYCMYPEQLSDRVVDFSQKSFRAGVTGKRKALRSEYLSYIG